MAIAFVGDIHGEARTFSRILNTIYEQHPEVTAVIQVGDFGFYPKLLPNFETIKPKIPVYAIDGNHEYFPMIYGIKEVKEMAPNIFYVPRGTVMELEGKRIGFCGGAASVDKMERVKWHMAWFQEEEITDADIAKFDGVEWLDILVTHVPPQSVIQKNFDPATLEWFGLPRTWRDQSADKIEALWTRLNFPTLLCGHMHRFVIDRTCMILNIDQIHVI
jgi:predicted phosphodiesterase